MFALRRHGGHVGGTLTKECHIFVINNYCIWRVFSSNMAAMSLS
jgi:hypothetical protein